MGNLTENRQTPELHVGGVHYNYQRVAATRIYKGALVGLTANNEAVPASDEDAVAVIGRAESTVEAESIIVVRRGAFLYDNGTDGEELTSADINKECYVVDDHTVGKVGGTAKIQAGIVLDVTTDGVAVLI